MSWDAKSDEPVTATQLAKETSQVLAAVRDEGRTVLVSHRGQIVAVITPTTQRECAMTVDLDDPGASVSTRDLARSGPAAALHAARNGGVRAITYRNRPVALLRSAQKWDGFDELFADIDEPGPEVHHDATVAGADDRQVRGEGRLAT